MADYVALLDEWRALWTTEDTPPVFNVPPEMNDTVERAYKFFHDHRSDQTLVQKKAREVVEQLFVWWLQAHEAPNKLPNSLHVRTGLALIEET